MSALGDAIDASLVCSKCGHKGKPGSCACFTRCGCGWWKERGAPGCSRCLAVDRIKVGPSRYEGRPGASVVTTAKRGIHWTYSIACGCGCEVTRDDGRLFRSNRDAMSVGIAQAFVLLDEARRAGLGEQP